MSHTEVQETDGRRAAGALTRGRLLAAATELLADQGEQGVTLRAVSRASGANVAAVQYHFGSRERLIAEVVGAASRHVVDAQLRALDALAVRAEPASAAECVAAWARPLAEVVAGRTAEQRRLGRIVGQTLGAPFEGLDVELRDLVTAPTDRLIAMLSAALPGVPRPELVLRVTVIAGSLAGLASGAFAPWLMRSGSAEGLEDRILGVVTRLALD